VVVKEYRKASESTMLTTYEFGCKTQVYVLMFGKSSKLKGNVPVNNKDLEKEKVSFNDGDDEVRTQVSKSTFWKVQQLTQIGQSAELSW
jgi:hypothetical protein